MANSILQSHFDPQPFTEGLTQGEHGIWYAGERVPVSYLEDGNAKFYELEEGSFWFAHRADCLCTVVEQFRPPGMLFDIGGGNGFVSARLMQAGFPSVVVEPGEAGARNAARRGASGVICATLATARFRPGVMPAAGAFDVLEHIEDDIRFLRDIHRCLAPGGRLYLTVPAYNWLWSHDDNSAGHFRRYTCSLLNQRLVEAGYVVRYSTYLFSLLPLPLFLSRSLPSLFGRRQLALQSYNKLHRPRLQSVTDRVWRWELERIRRDRSVPVGTSCLAVAEKP